MLFIEHLPGHVKSPDAELIINFVISHQIYLLSDHVSLGYCISCLLVCSRIFFKVYKHNFVVLWSCNFGWN